MIWRARCLSFFMGFLSLSQEILWVRLSSFAYRGAPQAFGVILGLYLLGIALGAGIGKRFCQGERNLMRTVSVLLLGAAILDMILPWLAVTGFGFGRAVGTVILAFCVVTTSMLKSIIFPIAHHLGSSNSAGNVGSSVSKVYFANIVGSALGPLVTGFVLLEYMTLQQNFMLMAGITLLVAAYCWHSIGGRWGIAMLPAGGLATALLVAVPGVMMGKLVDNTGNHEGPFKYALENRYGIIHVLAAKNHDDYVFGGNSYDGMINIDFMRDSNWISRVQVLAALQPQPARILVIGMSAGSWTRVLAAFPGVQHIDVVEINPGYVDVTKQYPAVKPILSDPRIDIHFDDGRRWLRRHPGEKYDLIVMNTTYHFRAYISMLLSREFLAMVKEHMNPGAVLAYNSTYSWDTFKTASTVFDQVYRFGNFIVTGDGISVPPEDEAVRRIGMLRVDGQPLIDIQDAAVAARLRTDLKQFQPYSEPALAKLAERPLEVITDQNMLTEYKFGESILGYLGKKRQH
jgi:predicted membrane-bound spermidine synthase